MKTRPSSASATTARCRSAPGRRCTWSPPRGLFASADGRYVGSRYLNKRNTALADAYSTVSALAGWRTDRWEVRLAGQNLTDRRDPVAESELGDAQYYRLPARRFDLAASVSF